MFGLGASELILVMALALIFIGPKRLPEIAKTLGKWTRKFKDATDEIRNSFTKDLK
ncbi:MAG: twin-arginine translocase TatA/TatE family subunit [bacterium]|nr:twin-arginine translocase TatA/TatE family subunit [bacterium]